MKDNKRGLERKVQTFTHQHTWSVAVGATDGLSAGASQPSKGVLAAVRRSNSMKHTAVSRLRQTTSERAYFFGGETKSQRAQNVGGSPSSYRKTVHTTTPSMVGKS